MIQDYYNYLVGCISVLWVQFHSSLIVHIMHPKLVDKTQLVGIVKENYTKFTKKP